MKFIFSLSLLAILTACGIAVAPAFTSTAIFLPDLKSKYDNICGMAANMQNAIPVDLNNDGRKDLVLPIWCFYKSGQDPQGPVINELIALVQTTDGSFIDKTTEIFGIKHPALDGKNQNWTVADFNGDGKPDIILGTDKEDGRPIIGNGDNMRAKAVALMSGPTFYSIIPFGIPRFGDNVIVVKNADDKLQLLIITADVQVEIWEYNNEWVKVSNEFAPVNPIQKNPVFINPRNDNKLDKSNFLINNVLNYICDDIGCIRDSYRLELWSKATGTWSKADEVQMLKIITVKAQTTGPSNFWTPTEARIASFEGKDYLDMGFIYDGCSIKLTPTSAPIGLRSFLGNEIIGGYTGQTTLNADWRPPTLKIFPTEVANGKLAVKSSILTETLTSNYYRMKCQDFNNDGFDDILIELGGGGALFYFNDKNGGFKKPKDGVIPQFTSQYFGYSMLYSDLTGDGIPDILYYPLIGGDNQLYWQNASSGAPAVPIPIYKAFRNIWIQ